MIFKTSSVGSSSQFNELAGDGCDNNYAGAAYDAEHISAEPEGVSRSRNTSSIYGITAYDTLSGDGCDDDANPPWDNAGRSEDNTGVSTNKNYHR